MPKATRILKQAQSDNFNSAVARNNHRKYETSDSIRNFKQKASGTSRISHFEESSSGMHATPSGITKKGGRKGTTISGNRNLNKNVYATGRVKGEVNLIKTGSNQNFP